MELRTSHLQGLHPLIANNLCLRRGILRERLAVTAAYLPLHPGQIVHLGLVVASQHLCTE